MSNSSGSYKFFLCIVYCVWMISRQLIKSSIFFVYQKFNRNFYENLTFNRFICCFCERNSAAHESAIWVLNLFCWILSSGTYINISSVMEFLQRWVKISWPSILINGNYSILSIDIMPGWQKLGMKMKWQKPEIGNM